MYLCNALLSNMQLVFVFVFLPKRPSESSINVLTIIKKLMEKLKTHIYRIKDNRGIDSDSTSI